MSRTFLVLLLLCCSLPAAARMYKWVDPQTGITQLSGKPPPWYRSGEDGPRVFVFERGKVVDDTGIKVTAAERDRLRQQALLEVSGNNQEARKQLLQARSLQAAMGSKDQEETAAPVEQPPAATNPPPPPPPANAGKPADQKQSTEEAMRDLINEWEKTRTDNAKNVVDGSAAGQDTASPPPPAGSAPPAPNR